MKAIVVHKYGGPEVLKWEEYPDPVPGRGVETLEFMAEAVRDGKLVIPISLKLPLSEAAKAQAAVEKGGVGKILLVA